MLIILKSVMKLEKRKFSGILRICSKTSLTISFNTTKPQTKNKYAQYNFPRKYLIGLHDRTADEKFGEMNMHIQIVV